MNRPLAIELGAAAIAICALGVGSSGQALAAAPILPTANCATPGHGVDRKGTSGSETITVDVADGQRVVVCTGGGTDTVVIRSIAGQPNLATQLWIAFGTGAKTIRWNAGTSNGFGMSFFPANTFNNQAVIVRPDANPDVNVDFGPNPEYYRSEWACGTNQNFIASANANVLSGNRARYLVIGQPGTLRNVNC